MNEAEVDYVVTLIMGWIEGQLRVKLYGHTISRTKERTDWDLSVLFKIRSILRFFLFLFPWSYSDLQV